MSVIISFLIALFLQTQGKKSGQKEAGIFSLEYFKIMIAGHSVASSCAKFYRWRIGFRP